MCDFVCIHDHYYNHTNYENILTVLNIPESNSSRSSSSSDNSSSKCHCWYCCCFLVLVSSLTSTDLFIIAIIIAKLDK